jgi:hypothetical protein
MIGCNNIKNVLGDEWWNVKDDEYTINSSNIEFGI